jgi:hypothetical protein
MRARPGQQDVCLKIHHVAALRPRSW